MRYGISADSKHYSPLYFASPAHSSVSAASKWAKCTPAKRGNAARGILIGVLKQLSRIVCLARLQLAAAHQLVVMADLVSAVGFRVVLRLACMAFNHDRRLVRMDAGKADALGDVADLRKCILLDLAAQPVENPCRIFRRGRAQHHHEFLAAEAEDPIKRTERDTQQIGDQDQYFIAVQMTEGVVDALEMVDVDHAQPLLFVFTGMTAFFLMGG